MNLLAGRTPMQTPELHSPSMQPTSPCLHLFGVPGLL